MNNNDQNNNIFGNLTPVTPNDLSSNNSQNTNVNSSMMPPENPTLNPVDTASSITMNSFVPNANAGETIKSDNVASSGEVNLANNMQPLMQGATDSQVGVNPFSEAGPQTDTNIFSNNVVQNTSATSDVNVQSSNPFDIGLNNSQTPLQSPMGDSSVPSTDNSGGPLINETLVSNVSNPQADLLEPNGISENIVTPAKNTSVDNGTRVVSVKDFLIYFILMVIPIVNIVVLIKKITNKNDPTMRNLAIAQLIMMGISVVIGIIISIIASILVVNTVNSVSDDISDVYNSSYNYSNYDY